MSVLMRGGRVNTQEIRQACSSENNIISLQVDPSWDVAVEGLSSN